MFVETMLFYCKIFIAKIIAVIFVKLIKTNLRCVSHILIVCYYHILNHMSRILSPVLALSIPFCPFLFY
jgi:hypothetical protein